MASTENLLDPIDYQSIVTDKHKKQGNKGKWPELKNFLFNPTDGWEILGRNLSDWGYLIAYYAVFYLSLLFVFGVLLGVYSIILDEINPTMQGQGSVLKFSPGLSFRPLPDFQTKLIRFIQGKPSTYKRFTDHIQTFLDQYENEKQVGENYIDCEKGRPEEMKGKVCRFNVDKLGGQCTWQKDYGYDEGKPCVIIKVNRIFRWVPIPYTEANRGEMPDSVNARWMPDHMPVSCEGRYPADLENIGNISYYPPEGVPRFFYPYINQEGYRSPLVMIRFDKPANGILIHVLCKVWATNVYYHKNDQLGMVTFEILVD